MWSLFGLGIGMTVASRQDSGKECDRHMSLYMSRSSASVSEGKCLMIWLWMSSGPGAVFPRSEMHDVSSSSVKSAL